MRSKMHCNAAFAITLFTLLTAQTTASHWRSLGDETHGAPSRARDASFGGYQILERFFGDNAPLGGRRGVYPRFVFEDTEGRFWIAPVTPGGVVELYDERTGRWDVFASRPRGFDGIHYHSDALVPGDIRYICQSKDGVMWFSDGYASETWKDKVLLSSFDGKQWRSYAFAEGSTGSTGLVRGIDGRTWFWSNDELRYYERGRWSEPTRISDVLRDPGPEMPPALVGTAVGQEIQRRYRTRYEIIAATQDHQGYLWLSTHSGVLTYSPRTGDWRKYPELKDTRASAIYEDYQGRVWLNESFDAVMYDRSNGSVATYKPVDHVLRRPDAANDYEVITGIHQDRRGRMIFATERGLVLLNEAEKSWTFAPVRDLGLGVDGVIGDVESIMEDTRGRIWVTTFTGIAVLGQSGVHGHAANSGLGARRRHT